MPQKTVVALFYLALLFCTSGCSDSVPETLCIIPEPMTCTMGKGTFCLSKSDKPAIDAPVSVKARLRAYLRDRAVSVSETAEEERRSRFRLIMRDTVPGVSSDEGYRLTINKGGVIIESGGEAGLFYGLQTLLQIKNGASLPFVCITDEPRFEYRGVMLDVSRHFFNKETIKRQIDAMASVKLNRLHLHLTDAAGWRLEIKRYPLLTKFAAWRSERSWNTWWNGDRKYIREGTPGAYGGYYTQEEVRELVAYAKERQITIVPEIEMPGHSEEVLTAYPAFSCTHKSYKEADFCPGNEETFEFLENVLSEVIELFPSEYIHIGGDEAGKTSWANCPLCQRRMKEKGLQSTTELQSYLIRRIGQFIRSKGRKMIGWDEVLDGGSLSDVTVMSWRGTEGGIAAVKRGNKAIMTPGTYCYLDQYQDAPATEPEAIGGYLPLEKVYCYDPIPEDLSVQEEKLIYGVQGNLWTEYVPTTEHLEYMLYPRVFALAEIAWSPKKKKNYNQFRTKALCGVARLQERGYSTFDLRKEKGNRPEFLSNATHLALHKTVIYRTPYATKYSAEGDTALTDGKRGSWSYNDGRWQGFIEDGIDVTIDLGQEMELHGISLDFIQVSNPEVFLPSEVILYASIDGKTFDQLAVIETILDPKKPICFKTYGWKSDEEGTNARFVRCVARSGTQGGWLFTDEVVVW